MQWMHKDRRQTDGSIAAVSGALLTTTTSTLRYSCATLEIYRAINIIPVHNTDIDSKYR